MTQTLLEENVHDYQYVTWALKLTVGNLQHGHQLITSIEALRYGVWRQYWFVHQFHASYLHAFKYRADIRPLHHMRLCVSMDIKTLKLYVKISLPVMLSTTEY